MTKETFEEFAKRHFPGIEKETWYPAIIAIGEEYAKQAIVNHEAKHMKLYDYLKKKGFERLLDEPSLNSSHAGSSQTYEELFEGYLKANEPKPYQP
jgi:hypothetical protein